LITADMKFGLPQLTASELRVPSHRPPRRKQQK